MALTFLFSSLTQGQLQELGDELHQLYKTAEAFQQLETIEVSAGKNTLV